MRFWRFSHLFPHADNDNRAGASYIGRSAGQTSERQRISICTKVQQQPKRNFEHARQRPTYDDDDDGQESLPSITCSVNHERASLLLLLSDWTSLSASLLFSFFSAGIEIQPTLGCCCNFCPRRRRRRQQSEPTSAVIARARIRRKLPTATTKKQTKTRSRSDERQSWPATLFSLSLGWTKRKEQQLMSQ